MKLCAIQQPYPYTPAEAPAAVDFLIRELDQCDDSLDLILLPEYSNCPSSFPPGESLEFARAHTEPLLDAVIRTARRCQAIVSINYCAQVGAGFRNTTRVFNRQGEPVGDYYKQQLTEREPRNRQIDNDYVFSYQPPTIVTVEGLRLGFVTCYDAYFNEYIEHLTYRQPDIVLVASHQRGERADIIEMLTCSLAFRANAFVVRASVGMGEGKDTGGNSMIVDPAGKILAQAGNRNGKLICDIGDPRRKYLRTDSFGGKLVANDYFISKGRTPWAYRPAGSSVKPNDQQMPYPRVCAHRGLNTIAPENTLPAFGAAIALGADEIELDVWPSLDQVPMVLHDQTLDRVSNGTGKITEKTCAELKQLDLGSRFSKQYAGVCIPTLEDILRAFPRQAIINLHLKTATFDQEYDQTFLRRIINLLRDYDCLEHVYIMGSPNVQTAMLEVAPEIPRCMAADPQAEKLAIVDNAIRYQCAKLQFIKPYFNDEMIRKAHAHGIKCNAYWSDDPQETQKMLKAGIDTILTNDFWQVAQTVRKFAAKL